MLRPGYAIEDLQWSADRVRNGFETLRERFLIGLDEAENVVRIVDFLKKDPPSNPNMFAAAVKQARAVPDCAEKLKLFQDLAELRWSDGNAEIETVTQTLSERFSKGLRPTPTPTPIPTHEPNNTPPSPPQGVCVTVGEPFGFADWWPAYPRKVGKQAALKAYRRAVARASPADLATGLSRALYGWRITRTEERFIPHPATWLNEGRWEDASPKPNGERRSSHDELVAENRRAIDRAMGGAVAADHAGGQPGTSPGVDLEGDWRRVPEAGSADGSGG